MARKQKKDYEERSSDEEDIGEEEDGPPTVNPYEVLDLEHEATADDVKKAYRKMALKHHPGKRQFSHSKSSAYILQTRPQMARKKPPTRSSKRSPSHMPFYPTTAVASATTSQAAPQSRSKTTRTLTG
jgi:hypothetical protein